MAQANEEKAEFAQKIQQLQGELEDEETSKEFALNLQIQLQKATEAHAKEA